MHDHDINCENTIHGVCCSVTDCVHHCDNKCTASEIHVGPRDASSTSETDCETFKHK